MNQKKTNVMRIFESHNIDFTVAEYEVDENNLDAVSAARKAGLDPSVVFKTIVMRNDKNMIFVFCVNAESEVNLKKARAVTGSREIKPVKMTELLQLTGYIRGGCSPVGMKKVYPVYIDETAQLFDRIYVSAGLRGMQVCVSPDDLAAVVNGEFADIAS
ncbi:MAG: Cys-tRNA(Pro) deacylase [Spirochaetia bacterium]|nr:Cys-tRNA(Pro) deacylase [Spirochaetia bacterium]